MQFVRLRLFYLYAATTTDHGL